MDAIYIPSDYLMHWKYIERYKRRGKWRYVYADDSVHGRINMYMKEFERERNLANHEYEMADAYAKTSNDEMWRNHTKSAELFDRWAYEDYDEAETLVERYSISTHLMNVKYDVISAGKSAIDSIFNLFKHSDSSDLYLEHHGILGQKWGVRRYQNEDGTLTEAGRKRYNQVGIMTPMAEFALAVRKAGLKMETEGMDINAKFLNPSKIEQLNRYNDMAYIGEYKKSKAENMLNRTKTKNYTAEEKFQIALLGEKTFEKMCTVGYDSAVLQTEYSKKKVDEYLEKLKDVPLEQVPSVRYYTEQGPGNYYTAYTWNGTKYQKIKHSDSSDPYLEHHGILGQKWGVRRYQNEDGTLTPLGKKKRGSIRDYSEDELRSEIERSKLEKEYNREVGYGSKYYKGKTFKNPFTKKTVTSFASDQELEAYVNRRYLEMKVAEADAREVEQGLNYINNIMRTAGNVISTASSATKLISDIDKFVSGRKDKDDERKNKKEESERRKSLYDSTEKLSTADIKTNTEREKARWDYVNAVSGGGSGSNTKSNKSNNSNKRSIFKVERKKKK